MTSFASHVDNAYVTLENVIYLFFSGGKCVKLCYELSYEGSLIFIYVGPHLDSTFWIHSILEKLKS